MENRFEDIAQQDAERRRQAEIASAERRAKNNTALQALVKEFLAFMISRGNPGIGKAVSTREAKGHVPIGWSLHIGGNDDGYGGTELLLAPNGQWWIADESYKKTYWGEYKYTCRWREFSPEMTQPGMLKAIEIRLSDLVRATTK